MHTSCLFTYTRSFKELPCFVDCMPSMDQIKLCLGPSFIGPNKVVSFIIERVLFWYFELYRLLGFSCRYDSQIVTAEELKTICKNDELSDKFIDLCVWICSQIKDYCSIEETITGLIICIFHT